jgi:hypothetical protein
VHEQHVKQTGVDEPYMNDERGTQGTIRPTTERRRDKLTTSGVRAVSFDGSTVLAFCVIRWGWPFIISAMAFFVSWVTFSRLLYLRRMLSIRSPLLCPFLVRWNYLFRLEATIARMTSMDGGEGISTTKRTLAESIIYWYCL